MYAGREKRMPPVPKRPLELAEASYRSFSLTRAYERKSSLSTFPPCIFWPSPLTNRVRKGVDSSIFPFLTFFSTEGMSTKFLSLPTAGSRPFVPRQSLSLSLYVPPPCLVFPLVFSSRSAWGSDRLFVHPFPLPPPDSRLRQILSAPSGTLTVSFPAAGGLL